MAELIDAVTSWPSLLGVLVVFGFAPGFCLRLIVLAYLRGDPRRDELIAEASGAGAPSSRLGSGSWAWPCSWP
jgi:hypothetical protein